MENYIVINGKKVELTKEQVRQLGIEVEKESPFERVQKGERFCYISYGGDVFTDFDVKSVSDDKAYAVANYCTDKNLMQQRAWFETLSRLLWRYSMEHGGNEIHGINYVIYKDGENYRIQCICNGYLQPGFVDLQTAEDAINRIIIPFMAEHPDFKW